MAKKSGRRSPEEWEKAKKKYRLSSKQIAMARELGMNPHKFGKIAPNKHEKWKVPIGEFIERIYSKRFKRERKKNQNVE